MTIQELSARAIEIREAFARFEKAEWGREWRSEDIALGLAGDVGDLVKLVQAYEGIRPQPDDLKTQLEHEIADCMMCLLVLANTYNVDVEEAFLRTMKQLEDSLVLSLPSKVEHNE